MSDNAGMPGPVELPNLPDTARGAGAVCGQHVAEPPFVWRLWHTWRFSRRVEESSNQRKHESTNPVVRWLVRSFHARVVDAVRSIAPRTVLDLGCGEGYTLTALVDAGIDADLHGIDLSARAVGVARERLGVRARIDVNDAHSVGDGDERFDLVMMLEVLEHLEDPESMLSTLARRSVRHVLLSVPWEPYFRLGNLLRGEHLSRLGNHPEHVNAWSRRGFLRFVEREFEIVSAPSAFPWTLVLARLRE